jgi:hypothetical protein
MNISSSLVVISDRFILSFLRLRQFLREMKVPMGNIHRIGIGIGVGSDTSISADSIDIDEDQSIATNVNTVRQI